MLLLGFPGLHMREIPTPHEDFGDCVMTYTVYYPFVSKESQEEWPHPRGWIPQRPLRVLFEVSHDCRLAWFKEVA